MTVWTITLTLTRRDRPPSLPAPSGPPRSGQENGFCRRTAPGRQDHARPKPAGCCGRLSDWDAAEDRERILRPRRETADRGYGSFESCSDIRWRLPHCGSGRPARHPVTARALDLYPLAGFAPGVYLPRLIPFRRGTQMSRPATALLTLGGFRSHISAGRHSRAAGLQHRTSRAQISYLNASATSAGPAVVRIPFIDSKTWMATKPSTWLEPERSIDLSPVAIRAPRIRAVRRSRTLLGLTVVEDPHSRELSPPPAKWVHHDFHRLRIRDPQQSTSHPEALVEAKWRIPNSIGGCAISKPGFPTPMRGGSPQWSNDH